MTDTTELRRLLAEATAGPWEPVVWNYVSRDEAVERFRHMLDEHGDALPRIIVTPNDELTIAIIGNGPASQVNSHLIVAAVNALPALLDELDALRAVVGAARDERDDTYDSRHGMCDRWPCEVCSALTALDAPARLRTEGQR